MSYTPNPLETKHIKLPGELERLIELLARNIHDVWARERMAEGWELGPERSDRLKQHPGIVTYDSLPDSEKEYDRSTALETLKTIMALGYRIEPPEEGSAMDQTRQAALLKICQTQARKLRRAGKPLQAYDEARRCLATWPEDLVLRQLEALSLADSGALFKARQLLEKMYEEGHRDVETVSILARTYKELWLQDSSDPETALYNLSQAVKHYQEAFKATGEYYPGINAATLAVVLGHTDEARRMAAKVRDQCQERLERFEELGESEYYLTATLAEALLVLGDLDAAAKQYAHAAKVGAGRHRDLCSTRSNARILLDFQGLDGAAVEASLALPSVAVFSGPALQDAHLDAEGEASVLEAIEERLATLDVAFGFASGAAGCNLIFLEAIENRGGQAHMVLPFNVDDFINRDVVVGGDSRWLRRFRSMYERLEAQGRVILASDWPIDTGRVSYRFAAQYLMGKASQFAGQLDASLASLAMWPEGAEPPATVAWWRSLGHLVERIQPSLAGCGDGMGSDREEEELAVGGAPDVSVKAILFADVFGYSRLREGQQAPFVEAFLGGVARMLKKLDYAPRMRNTWGDALYMIFDSVAQAGEFALKIVDFINTTRWSDLGLPEDFTLRVSVHAGPVFACRDPILESQNYLGTHVSHAARLEPITPPGNVYATEAFAALAAATGVTRFTCDYVGRTPYAKGYGTHPAYHVRWR